MKTDLEKLEDLYYSGVKHEENQSPHLRIIDPDLCSGKCIDNLGAPCVKFCPAQVYELSENRKEIKIQAANCLHCKTCQIKDPYQNIEWTFPEGGGGPGYREM